MSSVPPRSPPTISLNANEVKLFGLLQECAASPPSTSTPLPKIELRVAGGWVRDKLLGRESDDIDVTVGPKPITGLFFATVFEQWLHERGMGEEMGKLTKIDAKPTQSKHLETATAVVCGLSVDWVQQRGDEVYNDSSRIPIVNFGTPLSDAERRDLTINALFYNLATRQVEDLTQRGLSDLENKVIRTPVDPVTTFRDDPLRVIRAVRFASRLGKDWKIDTELTEAIARPEIRDALRDAKKISRERVGIELEKMLTSANRHYSLQLIVKLNLYDLVFLYDPSSVLPSPSTSEVANVDPNLCLRPARILHDLLDVSGHLHTSLHRMLRFTPSSSPDLLLTSPPISIIKRLYLSAALFPIYPLQTLKKNKQVWLGETILMEGIKSSAHDKDWCVRAKEASEKIPVVVRGGDELDRADIGMMLRHTSVHDETIGKDNRWNWSVFWSLVVDLATHDDAEAPAIIALYNKLIDRIVDSKLDTDAFAHPLLNGDEVRAILKAVFASTLPQDVIVARALPRILNIVLRYQFTYPGNSKSQAEDWLNTPQGNELVLQAFEEVKEEFRLKNEEEVNRKLAQKQAAASKKQAIEGGDAGRRKKGGTT